MSKKIIIPKGLVNPNETTVIEIPEELSNERELVASPLPCPGGCSRKPSNFGKTQTIYEQSTPPPGSSVTRMSEETYEYVGPSPPKDQTYAARYEPSSFRNAESGRHGACPGRTFSGRDAGSSGRPVATEITSSFTDTTRTCSGATRMVKKTSKTYLKQPIQESSNMGNVTYPGATRNRTGILEGIPRESMSFRSPVAASSPRPRDLTYAAMHDTGPLNMATYSYGNIGGGYQSSAPARTSYNFGKTQTMSPRALSAPSRVVKKSSKTYIRQTMPGGGSGMRDSATSCPAARAADSPWLGSMGRPRDSFSIRAPQATSTPQPKDRTYTAIYDSNMLSSYSTYEPTPFSTFDIPNRTGGKTYSLGGTHSVCPGGCTEESIGTSNVLEGVSPMPQMESPSYRYPQATSTPRPRDLTYSARYDSSPFRSDDDYESESFDTYPGSDVSGRTFNFGKTQGACPGIAQPSRSTTRVVKKTSQTYMKSPTGRSSGSPALGATYAAAPSGSCSPRCPNAQGSSPQKTGTNLVQKTSKTTTNRVICDGTQIRTSEEVSTMESNQSPSNNQQPSLMKDIQSRLKDIENTERSRFSDNLRLFQDARRALMANTTYTFGDKSAASSQTPSMQCDSSCPSRRK